MYYHTTAAARTLQGTGDWGACVQREVEACYAPLVLIPRCAGSSGHTHTLRCARAALKQTRQAAAETG